MDGRSRLPAAATRDARGPARALSTCGARAASATTRCGGCSATSTSRTPGWTSSDDRRPAPAARPRPARRNQYGRSRSRASRSTSSARSTGGTPLVLAAIHGNESETTVALSAAARMTCARGPALARSCSPRTRTRRCWARAGTPRPASTSTGTSRPPTGRAWTVVSHWSSQTTQVVELSTGDPRGLRAGGRRGSSRSWSGSPRAGSSRSTRRSARCWSRRPSALGEWLVEGTRACRGGSGSRTARLACSTDGRGEQGILAVTLELPKTTHDAAVVRYAPVARGPAPWREF